MCRKIIYIESMKDFAHVDFFNGSHETEKEIKRKWGGGLCWKLKPVSRTSKGVVVLSPSSSSNVTGEYLQGSHSLYGVV